MKTKDIVYIALFAALTAALGLFPPITVPIAAGVPITAQSMGVMLAGGILGARRGALAMLLFLALLAIGLPLLAGGRGGLGIFAGPSGGFLFGWVLAAGVVGWLTGCFWAKLNLAYACLFNTIGGIGVVYALGIPWLHFATEMTLIDAATAAAVFIPGDIVKALVAAMVIVTVKRAYPLFNLKPVSPN